MPKGQRPAPARPAAPAYMQRLKSFEGSQAGTKVVLKNGLTILIHEIHSLPIAAISTYVRAGHADETEETAGISEILTHLYFRGTSTKPSGTISREAKALGATLSSEAAYDHTTHDIVVGSAQWKKALEIQSDAFLNPLVDESDLRRAVELALQRNQRQLEDPEIASRRKLLEVGFDRRGPGRSPIGQEVSARALSRSKVLDYLKTHYTADRTIIVVSGDVTDSEVLSEAVKLYDKAMPAAGKGEPRSGIDIPKGFHYGEERGKTDVPHILFGFPTAAADSTDFFALEILRAILGVGDASLISDHLVEKQKVVISGAADQTSFAGTGYLVIRMKVDPANIDKSEIGLLTELELLKRQAPEEEEMERALAQLEREYWERMQAVLARAHLVAKFEVVGDWKKMQQYLTGLRQVKPEDVRRVAGKYLPLERCTLLEYLGPGVEARNLNSETAFNTFRDLLPASADQMMADYAKETVPAIKSPEQQGAFKFSEVRFPFLKASILRGPELMIREDHSLPLIHLGFFYPGGRFLEGKENAGITSLTLSMILRGTRTLGPREVRRQLGLYGAKMVPVVDRDYFGVQLSVLSRNVEPALELMADLFQGPAFSEEEVSRQKALQIASIRARSPWGDEPGRRLIRAMLFKDHPYGLDSAGTEAGCGTFGVAAVRDWYESNIRNKKPIVVIVGDTQGSSLAGFFVRRFSGSRFQDLKIPEGFPKVPESRTSVEEKRESAVSLVLLGYQAPPDGDEDSYAVMVLQNLLSGEGGRLTDQLVYGQALASDATVDYETGVRGGAIVASLSTAGGNEEKALQALEAELQKVIEGPITYREYRSAINSAVGNYWLTQQYRFFQISALVRNIIAGRDLDALLDMTSRLQDVKQEDLPDVARRLLSQEKSVVVRLHGIR